MISQANWLTLSDQVYRLMLHLYPAPFRREYGYHMAQMFRDDVHGTLQQEGVQAVLGLWLLAFFDLLKTAVVEHVCEIMHRPKKPLVRWSGPAGALGGLLYPLAVLTIIYGPLPFTLSLLVTVPLLGWGLFGLFTTLPAVPRRLDLFAFLTTLSGLLLCNFGAILLVWLNNPLSNWDNAIFAGLGLWIMGLATMGTIANANKSLGQLSLTPLLAVIALTGIGTLYGSDPTSLKGVTLLSAYAAIWILLGIAIWQAPDKPKSPVAKLLA